MKTFCIFILALSFIFANASFAASDPDNDFDKYTKALDSKLKRGLANVVTCQGELARSIGDSIENDGFIVGATYGILKGAVLMLRRATVGVLETATFFIPSEPVLDDPDFFKD